MDISKIVFASPEFLWLLILIPLLIVYKLLRRNSQPAYIVSDTTLIKSLGKSIRYRLRFIPFLFRILALTLLIIALAAPQITSVEKDTSSEGIDIVIAMDVSTSMDAQDFKPDRLEAAKNTAKEFINYRINDRIGLVLFAGESFTQCPITIDHDILKSFFSEVKTGMIEDGTAIGMGLSTAVSRLKDSKAKSKIIILMTDGVNNTGKISPLTAADIANSYNIRVYTIGIGTKGKAPYLANTPYGKQFVYIDVEIDEELLKEIANNTGGQYYRAVNNKVLEDVYKNIDKLEKTKINQLQYKQVEDLFIYPLAAGLALLIIEIFLALFFFRTLPR